jgi:hypothetical protein
MEAMPQQSLSSEAYQPDLEAIRKIHEEEEKINQQLREKSVPFNLS